MTAIFPETEKAITVYKSEYAETYYDPITDCVMIKWIKFSPSIFFREIFEKVLPEILKSQPQRLLLDQRRIKIIAPADQLWLIDDWYFKVSSTNRFYKVAFIDADDLFGKLSIKNIATKMSTTSKVCEVKIFNQLDEAQVWLNQ